MLLPRSSFPGRPLANPSPSSWGEEEALKSDLLLPHFAPRADPEKQSVLHLSQVNNK